MQYKTLVKAVLRLITRSLVEPSRGTICRALSSMSSFPNSNSSTCRIPLASPSSTSILYNLSSCSSRVVMYKLIAEPLSNPNVLQNPKKKKILEYYTQHNTFSITKKIHCGNSQNVKDNTDIFKEGFSSLGEAIGEVTNLFLNIWDNSYIRCCFVIF